MVRSVVLIILYVCLSIWLSIRLCKKTYDQIFYTCYLWPWLGPPLAIMRYVLPMLRMTSCFRIVHGI